MYISPITTLIVYILTFYSRFYTFDVIMFLLYFFRHDKNTDDQSI